MNVTELARKLKINSQDLLDILPEFGFDVGKKAIKVDDRLARKILEFSVKIKDRLEAKKEAAMQELRKLSQGTDDNVEKKEIVIPAIITVRDFAKIVDRPVNEVIKELMKNGVMASLNQKIDFDTAAIVADELGIKLILSTEEQVKQDTSSRVHEIIMKEKNEDLQARPPVIVVMGHVDHGKTKLLDAIRTTNVMEGEAGGITQHIGAYQVEKKGQILTFIDTPGHEAFTAMRSRGAKIADIAVLVVAANDSVKPQTLEAIKIIQQAKIPMIVAINKIDLPEANIEKVKQDLASLNLVPEDWGGKTIVVPISAKQYLGIDDLLDTILLITEMEKDKIVANPQNEAVGTIIESHIDKGQGPVATVLVQNGTLKLGDNICINNVYYGKAKGLQDYKFKDIKEAGPSNPVKIIGFKYAPNIGDIAEVTCNVGRKQKKVKEYDLGAEESMLKTTHQKQTKEGVESKKIFIIIKADVLGSLEVITESLEKIESKEVKIKIISKGLGSITDSDVDLASSSEALVIGFHVRPTSLASELARDKNVEIKYYDVIYKLIEDIKERYAALLSPDIVRKELGRIEVLAIFKTEDNSMIVGGRVLNGKIIKDAKVEVQRKNELVGNGEIVDLQSGRQSVTEVDSGQECGLNFKGKPIINQGDVLLVYKEEIVKKKI